MALQTHVPLLTGGSGIDLKKQIKTEFILSCPKCGTKLDVTNLSFGTHIECPSCNNITFRPEYKPPWWSKTRNFILTMIGTFLLGFASSFFAAVVYESYKDQKTNTENKKSDSTKPDLLTKKIK